MGASRAPIASQAVTSSPNTPAKIVVIGVGNLLLKDEGVGVHVIRELRTRSLPPDAEVRDGGVGGIDLLDTLDRASHAVLVDAAEMGLEPGAVRRFRPDQVQPGPNAPRFSSHDIGLLEVLQLAQALGRSPEEVVILGIQPKEIDWSTELSPEVRAAVPKAVEMVLAEIKRIQGT
jgi:hydrogenase maturation protease